MWLWVDLVYSKDSAAKKTAKTVKNLFEKSALNLNLAFKE